MNIKHYLIFISFFSIYGADITFSQEQLKHEESADMRCTLFGGSEADRKAFDRLYSTLSESKKCFFDSPHNFRAINDIERAISDCVKVKRECLEINCTELANSCDKSTELNNQTLNKIKDFFPEQELAEKKLSYFFKPRAGHAVDILFSAEFNANRSYNKEKTLAFSDLIADVFSKNKGVNEVYIYAPFSSEHKGIGHVEFMQMHCTMIGASQRYEREHPSNFVVRNVKYACQESCIFLLTNVVRFGEWGFAN